MNYRADVSVVLPGGSIGDAEGHLFGHFRLGQGDGLALRPTLTATPNSTAFRLTNPDDSTALLAQAWYQLDVPLGGSLDEAPSRVEFNVGKMDPFVFFDQNGIADDESSRFLNNVFVHNPLLDSGGDAGVDRYGFTPGMRLAYQDDHASPDWWRVSLGVFGSGPGASFDDSFVKPFVIAQVERAAQWLPGRDGTYRLYAWSNGRAGHYDGIREERHSGWGLSLEQQVSDATTLFARYGDSTRGHVRFDRALTLGGELSGAAWGREHDRLGLALGWLRSSAGYRADDPDGYGPDGSERLAELYYTWQANERFELSPDVQWIGHPGGRGGAGNITLFGLRAKLSY
jgi:high affinity Mn2+ porin